MRLLFICTHPSQTTGYSRVVYNIAKQLEKYPQIKCTIFGIQNFTSVNKNYRSNLPKNVSVWDVYQEDKEDFGFGTQSLAQFILINDPDVIMIYNDAEVIKKYILNITLVGANPQFSSMIKKPIKIVAYLDQVHKNQNPNTLKYIADNANHVFCFTEKWKHNYLRFLNNYIQYNMKTSVVRHGVDVVKMPKSIKEYKQELKLPQDSFIFLNLNRYAVKKRLDISIIAFVKFLKQTKATNAYLIFPSISEESVINKLKTIYSYELFNHNLSEFQSNLIVKNEILSDEDINKYYYVSDVGLNSCDGEGFGLCNYEHASFGRPQIVSKVGGLVDFFSDSNSLMCEPKYTSYSIENEYGEVISSDDMAECMSKYFLQKPLYNKHADLVKQIPKIYKWETEVENMMNVLLKL